MADLDNNGIDDAVEAAEYKKLSASAKFKQMIFYGLGGGMVFGTFSVLGQTLAHSLPAAAGIGLNMATLLPLAGLAGLALLGVGALYMSAKYLAAGTALDQKMQAKQIAAKTIAPEIPTQAKTIQTFPSKAEGADLEVSDAPQTKWTEKFTPAASKPLLARNDNEASWGDKVKSAAPGTDQRLAAL